MEFIQLFYITGGAQAKQTRALRKENPRPKARFPINFERVQSQAAGATNFL